MPAAPRQRPCPICGKPADQRFQPFCSARCRQIDLGRWLNGSYVIPVENEMEEDDGAEAEGRGDR